MAKLQFKMFKENSLRVMRVMLEKVKLHEQRLSIQCTAKKRVKDSEWFKDKMLLAQAQEAGVVLHKEQQDFMADRLEENDDYCDDQATASEIFMASLSFVESLNDDTVTPNNDSNTLSKVPHYDTYNDCDVLNSYGQETKYIEHIISNKDSYDELTSDNKVISYDDYMAIIEKDDAQNVPPPEQEDDMMLSAIKQMKSQVEQCIMVNQEAKSVNESLTSELEKYKERVKTLEKEYSSKQFLAKREAFLDFELRTVIVDRNQNVDASEIQETLILVEERRVSYTDASGSKPRSNTRNDRIPRPSSKSQKNKVEVKLRKFKSSSNKNNHVLDCNANVKNIALSKNSANVCLSCNECLFSANHDACVVKYLKDVQKRKKIVEIVLIGKSEAKSCHLPNVAHVLPRVDNAAKDENPKCWLACCRIIRRGTGVRVGRGGRGRRHREGNDEHVDDLNGQGNDQGMGANEGVEGVNGNVEGANGGAPDFSTIIAQQLQNLLPAMLAQVGNQGNVRNQNGNVVNENVQENVANVIVNGNRVGCSYKEFLACDPKEYDGKGGDVVLSCWIEKMESVHDMSGCSIDQKVKYTAGSFVGKALTWWNSQIRTLSQEVAVSMSWNDFKFMMIQEFCPSHEMQKLESELWHHAMVRVGHVAYTDRFHELARLVPHLVTPESRMIERYVYGLALQIRRMVAVTEPKTI
ncbi:reverse transcriptase domain-containing protein [Tanacetum coccineum]